MSRVQDISTIKGVIMVRRFNVFALLLLCAASDCFSDNAKLGSNMDSLTGELARWVQGRESRDVERTDVPEMDAARLAFEDRASNRWFNVTLHIETNRINVAIGDGSKASGREKEFDLFCALANEGRTFWRWRRDVESNSAVLGTTLYDWTQIGLNPTNIVAALVDQGEAEFCEFAPAIAEMRNGKASPEESFAGLKLQSEGMPDYSGGKMMEGLDRVSRDVWDALVGTDQLAMRWVKAPQDKFVFNITLDPAVTALPISTNLVGFIMANRCYVSAFLGRPYGEGDKLEKMKRYAELVNRLNQNRGDGRWFVVEGGEFCVRGTFPTERIIDDPKWFVSSFVMSAAVEILSHEKEMMEAFPVARVTKNNPQKVPVHEYACCLDGGETTGKQPVKSKKPSAWGLYDMLGNVWEWCVDCRSPYGDGLLVDPEGEQGYIHFAMRGGSFRSPGWKCRYADRGGSSWFESCDVTGFRPIIVPVGKWGSQSMARGLTSNESVELCCG